ncbi:hypothetical protein ACWGNZ_22905 (plasmid) [Sphingomonas zeae]
MRKMVVIGVASAIVLARPATAIAQNADSFDFAVARTAAWSLKATTSVNWNTDRPNALPTISSVSCRGESPQLDFEVNDAADVAWLGIRFLGQVKQDGEQDEITLIGDHLWLYIDGTRWEYANIYARPSEFSNIKYPGPDDGIIMPVWRGYHAIRMANSDPWMNIRVLYDRIINAKKLEWSYKSRDWSNVNYAIPENRLPANWQTQRYKINNTGLKQAIKWCAGQITSKTAFSLPSNMQLPTR